MDWNALAGIGSIGSAIATFLAALVALVLGVWPIWQERKHRYRKANILRIQMRTQFSLVRDVLNLRMTSPGAYHFDRPRDTLEILWNQADLLEDDEYESVSRSVGRLVSIRDTVVDPVEAANLKQLIDQTSDILTQHISKKK
jgi:hypothetical protein